MARLGRPFGHNVELKPKELAQVNEGADGLINDQTRSVGPCGLLEGSESFRPFAETGQDHGHRGSLLNATL